MMRRNTSGLRPGFRNGVLILLGILIILSVGCESVFGPDAAEDTSDDETEIARIIITNNYDADLDIYMDGDFQFTVLDGKQKKIRGLTLDEHDLEATKTGTRTVVDEETIDVTDYQDYTWEIADPPDIQILNSYGIPLKIYMDGEYLFNMVDEETRWLMDVTFEKHFLKATKVSDDKEVASTTINVEENTNYSWTIQ
jgi:hypothetical protein